MAGGQVSKWHIERVHATARPAMLLGLDLRALAPGQLRAGHSGCCARISRQKGHWLRAICCFLPLPGAKPSAEELLANTAGVHRAGSPPYEGTADPTDKGTKLARRIASCLLGQLDA